MDEELKYYGVNDDNYSEFISDMKLAHNELVEINNRMIALKAGMENDPDWCKMGKEQSIAFLDILSQMMTEIVGLELDNDTSAVGSMIMEMKSFMDTMDNFVQNSNSCNVFKQYMDIDD